MKKLLILLTAVILMLSATACQNDPLDKPPQETEAETSANTVVTDVVTVTETAAETEPEDDSEYDELRPDYNLGTCRVLEGNVSVVLFYMDDFESSWTKAEISRFTEKEIEPALSFLEKEARSYGIKLDLTIGESYGGVLYDGHL